MIMDKPDSSRVGGRRISGGRAADCGWGRGLSSFTHVGIGSVRGVVGVLVLPSLMLLRLVLE